MCILVHFRLKFDFSLVQGSWTCNCLRFQLDKWFLLSFFGLIISLKLGFIQALDSRMRNSFRFRSDR